MLDALELRLDVLLRDLEQPQDTVIGFLGNHIKDVSEPLRAALAPCLVNTERHVLGTLLPPKQLDISLALIHTISIVKPWAREDTNHLCKFDNTLGERGNAMFQIFKRLLIDLGIKNIMDCIHLCLPVLFIHVALLLQLPRGITVFLDVDFVRCTLHCQTVHLFAKFENVAFVLTKTTLHTTHTKIQSTQSARSFSTSELSLLFHSSNLLESFLLLLSNIIFESGLGISHIPLQVTPHHGNLIEAIAQRILSGVKTLLGRCQILVGKVNTAVQGIYGLV